MSEPKPKFTISFETLPRAVEVFFSFPLSFPNFSPWRPLSSSCAMAGLHAKSRARRLARRASWLSLQVLSMAESDIKSNGANAANAITPAIGSRLRSYGIIVVAVTVLAFLGLTRSHFMSLPNIYSLFYGVSLDFYCVAGFTILIIMGEIDLSVGSVYGLAGTTAGYLATQGLPIWLSTAAALGIGIFVGLFNGLLVVHLRINSIILTIGTLLLVRGLADVVAAKMAGERYIEAFRDIARTRVFSVNWTIIAL